MNYSLYIAIVSGKPWQLESLPLLQKLQAKEQLVEAVNEEDQKAECYFSIVIDLFEAGFVNVGKGNFRKALQYFHDCHRPAEECYKLATACRVSFHINEMTVKRQELYLSLSSAEAQQAIAAGDAALHEALNDRKNLCMDKVYDAIDLYRLAVVKTREINIEVEAIAMSRLGCVYDKVLRMKGRGHDYFTQCMTLAMSLHPKVFTTESWFVECRNAFERRQAEAIAREQQDKGKARENCKSELIAEFKELEDSDTVKNPSEFLKFVYKKFPPKKTTHTLDESKLGERAAQKKTLMKAISHYHPDKQDEQEHGLKWVVLCDEITKRLNSRYVDFKEE